MIEKILVALDGSTVAELVLPYVERIATRGRLDVILARVVPAPTSDVLAGPIPRLLTYAGAATAEPSDATVRSTQGDRSEAEHYLEGVAARLRARGVAVETAVIAGQPAEALIAEADLRQADLIMLSTHGRSGLGRLVYGSVAEAVVAGSHVPVFLARAWPTRPAQPFGAGKPTFLVAVDGSPSSERAIAVGASLAGQLGAELRLVEVVPPVDGSVGPEKWIVDVSQAALDAEVDLARTDLAERAQQLVKAGTPATSAIRVEPIGSGIVDEAKASNAALIVMATHANTGLARLLVHGIALEVLHRTDLPLLLVGPGGP